MDNIRTESFLGGDKVIVGNKYTDLVLETLGKVYIKTGNSSRVLSDVLKLLDQVQDSEIQSQTIIVGSTLEMEQMEYPGDGFFVYNTLTTTLYLSYDQRYVALIEAAEGAGDGYVRRRGDTMTGQLEINTVGPPLIVASSKLVSNLNAEYIDGYASDDLAKKKVDEFIYGNWTFKGKGVSENNWVFKENVRMYGDLVTSNSITSPEFASGFGGYGWRLDADTNTLTVDYLVVRKAMRVYEMVINKISATNGSIWVSNSSKCSDAVQPTILTDLQLKSMTSWTGSEENKNAMLRLLKTNTYYVPIPSNNANTESTVTLTSEISKPSAVNTTPKTFVNYKFIIHIKDPIGLVNSSLFKGPQTLYDETLLSSEWETYSGTASEADYLAFKKCISLYYINKEKVVTKWGGNEGQWDEGTIPIEWTYQHTFDKDFSFYMIPKTSTAASDFEKNGPKSSYLTRIKTYYKYFALEQSIINTAIQESNAQFNANNIPTTKVPNLWVVNTDDDEYPLFKPGDIIRCQKYTDGNIKYYDAIIMSQIGSRQYIVQKAVSVFDIYTEIHYNEDGSVASTKEEYNTTQYDKTESSYNVNTGTRQPKSSEANSAQNANPDSSAQSSTSRLDDIASGDDMIQMGNIYDVQRQNAIYLTSCDDDGPFIDVISGLNRPDYSVLYDIPIYKRQEFIYRQNNSTFKYNGIKYKYYIQENQPTDGTFSVYPITVGKKSYYGTLYPTKDSLVATKDNKYRHAYTKTTRVRVGNLDGIYNEIFGNKQPYGFGLYGENVFLTGEFYLSNGTSIVDFSEENILLKFKMAGLTIRDVSPVQQVPVIGLDGKPVLDEDGNQVYRNKTEIYMNADQFIFSIAGNPTMSLKALFNPETGQIENRYLDVQGWIQSNGLYVYPKGYVSDPNNPTKGAVSYITDNGRLVANNAYFTNCYVNGEVVTDKLTATGGRIGNFYINGNILQWGMGSSTSLKFGWLDVRYGNLSRYGYQTLLEIVADFFAIPIMVFNVTGAGIFASVKSQSSAWYPAPDSIWAGWFDGNVRCTDTVIANHFGSWSQDSSTGIVQYFKGVEDYVMTQIDRGGHKGRYNIHVKNGLIVQIDH